MPVIAKTTDLLRGNYFIDYFQYCKNYTSDTYIALITNVIDSVWSACVEFIKWYNTQEHE